LTALDQFIPVGTRSINVLFHSLHPISAATSLFVLPRAGHLVAS